jgi:CheY-like chemotaxis protein
VHPLANTFGETGLRIRERVADRALDAGFDGYITKPVEIAALRQEIKRFL